MPDELVVITCEDAASWNAWLAANHMQHRGVWLKIAKKGTVASVTNDEAVEVGLCWGWISGHRKALDGTYFLQRYTPRRPQSNWSAVNVARVKTLTAAGRMMPPGLAEVDAAKADGRWERESKSAARCAAFNSLARWASTHTPKERRPDAWLRPFSSPLTLSGLAMWQLRAWIGHGGQPVIFGRCQLLGRNPARTTITSRCTADSDAMPLAAAREWRQ